jgi:hypothetical protein
VKLQLFKDQSEAGILKTDVIAGLDPAISLKPEPDARVKPGHDV